MVCAPLRIVRSGFVRSKWVGLGAQKGIPSAPQPLSSACQCFPIISYEIPSREKVLRRPSVLAVTQEGGRAFPERTIGERTILGVSELFVDPGKSRRRPVRCQTLGVVLPHLLCEILRANFVRFLLTFPAVSWTI